jgi:uncharacterized membrane protein HdeD (DUF308 family)
MFFNKVANPTRNFIRGIVSIAIGSIIIVVPDLTINLVIQFLGGLLILDGLINFILSLIRNSNKQSMLFIVPRGTANIIFGFILMLFPSMIVGFFVFLFGFFLIIAGGYQLASQFSNRKKIGFSLLFTLFSLVALLAGIFMLTNPFKSASAILIFFGVVFAMYGAGEVIWSFKIRKFLKRNPHEHPNVIDAEYEEAE